MSKYTVVQVLADARSVRGIGYRLIADELEAFADLLRERESAKAVVTDEVIQLAIVTAEKYSNATRIGWDTMRAALEAVAPMLTSARVPDEKEDLDPVRLRREGRVATEWERGFNEGWNDCRDAMLAAAPKPDVEERHHWLCCGALKSDHSDKPRVMPDCFDPERHVWAISPKPETEE